MKPKVIVEINGKRHKMIFSKAKKDSCRLCSISNECTKVIGCACLFFGNCHFIEEK